MNQNRHGEKIFSGQVILDRVRQMNGWMDDFYSVPAER